MDDTETMTTIPLIRDDSSYELTQIASDGCEEEQDDSYTAITRGEFWLPVDFVTLEEDGVT